MAFDRTKMAALFPEFGDENVYPDVALEAWRKREKELSRAVTSALRSELPDPRSRANAHLVKPCYWTSRDWLHEITGLPPAKGFRTAGEAQP